MGSINGGGDDAGALDRLVDAGDARYWSVETIFGGHGGNLPMVRRTALPSSAKRTRVVLKFDAATGMLVADAPVVVYQERQWAAEPSVELTFRERKADGEYDKLDGSGLERSGIDGIWASKAVGITCFGGGSDAKKPPSPPDDPNAAFTLSLAGGIELRGAPGLLEVACTIDESRTLRLRRTGFDADEGVCRVERIESSED